eukprot:CAMPEP_0194304108 /NCGR_PEP_ID=MMETSP0171-20130528/1906_1 /TAXON_ID=218684 /ORGANISM="Corethron pennatum, Strain L29A3" /LENGTH=100 /DNA_ID=CAMNT_0039055257 /DNA_START=81 /DNA_END=383 /DNA_ORIENTATION=-
MTQAATAICHLKLSSRAAVASRLRHANHKGGIQRYRGREEVKWRTEPPLPQAAAAIRHLTVTTSFCRETPPQPSPLQDAAARDANKSRRRHKLLLQGAVM